MSGTIHPDRQAHFQSQPSVKHTATWVPRKLPLPPQQKGHLDVVKKPVSYIASNLSLPPSPEAERPRPAHVVWEQTYQVSAVNSSGFKISDKNLRLDCDILQAVGEQQTHMVPPSPSLMHVADTVKSVVSDESSSILHPLSLVMSQEMYALGVGDSFDLRLFICENCTELETAWCRTAWTHQYAQWGQLVTVNTLVDGSMHVVISFGGQTMSLHASDKRLQVFASYPPFVYLAMNIHDYRSKLMRSQMLC